MLPPSLQCYPSMLTLLTPPCVYSADGHSRLAPGPTHYFPTQSSVWQVVSLSLDAWGLSDLSGCAPIVPLPGMHLYLSPSLHLSILQDPVQILPLPLISSFISASLLLYHPFRNITKYCRLFKWFMFILSSRFIHLFILKLFIIELPIKFQTQEIQWQWRSEEVS